MAERANERVNISENEKKVLDILMRNSNATVAMMTEKPDISNATIRRAIKSLIDKKTIKRVGPDKGGHWEIVDKD